MCKNCFLFEIIDSTVKLDNAVQIDWILLPGWTVLQAIISVWLYKTRLQLTTSTKLINIFGLTLILLSCAKIGWFVVNNASAGKPNPVMATASTLDDQVAGQPTIVTRPDIYFIILGAYARGDILRDYYNYDNTPLLSQADPTHLRERGFFVADQSMANYSQTCLSLSATLNMHHYDDLIAKLGNDSVDLRSLTHLLHHNKVMDLLRKEGYTFNCFGTGHAPTEIKTADHFYVPSFMLDDFQSEIFNSTPIPFVQKIFNIPTGRRRRTLYAFEYLSELARATGPKLVFAHILAPHEPFIFGPDGEMRHANGRDQHSAGFDNKASYTKAYRDQLIYINKRVVQTVDSILKTSATPPVIILQSDHGPASQLDWNNPTPHALRERMAILNAFLLPGFDPEKL